MVSAGLFLEGFLYLRQCVEFKHIKFTEEDPSIFSSYFVKTMHAAQLNAIYHAHAQPISVRLEIEQGDSASLSSSKWRSSYQAVMAWKDPCGSSKIYRRPLS